MKGRVTCLGAMFSRRNKIKNAIMDDALVPKEKGIHEVISPKEIGRGPTAMLAELNVLLNPPQSPSPSHGELFSRESHLGSDPAGFVVQDPAISVASAPNVGPAGSGLASPASGYGDVGSWCSTAAEDSSPAPGLEDKSNGLGESVFPASEYVLEAGVASDHRSDLVDERRSESHWVERLLSSEDEISENGGREHHDSRRNCVSFEGAGRNCTIFVEKNGSITVQESYLGVDAKSICSSPVGNDGGIPDCTAVREFRGRRELDFGHRNFDDVSIVSCPQGLPSYDSGSSTTGDARIGAAVGLGSSPKSETALGEKLPDICLRTEVLVSTPRKAWWKLFLVSHRNIHREVIEVAVGRTVAEGEGGENPLPVNGYVSDFEDRSGRTSPLKDEMCEVGEVLKREISGSLLRNCYSEQDLQRPSVQENFVASHDGASSGAEFHDSHVETVVSEGYNALSVPRKWDALSEKSGLSRVMEWVSSVPSDATFDCDQEDDVDIGNAPDSPTTSAAPFFGHFESFTDNVEKSGAVRVEGSVDVDQEMARMVARSVNPLSTMAYFSGVGLKVFPNLGIFTGLKSLNLSANHLVRMTSGTLPKSLRTLDLSRNQIVVIEGLRDLTRLRTLNLSYNRVARIGTGLSGCMSLKELYLAGNKLSEVEDLHRLSKLTVLDLSFNKLSTTKSLGQIAANYKTLQAVNLLGNAVLSNLGDDHLRRFVTGVCPQVLYLNKQPIKLDNSAARAPMGKGGSSGKTLSKASKRGVAHHAPLGNHRHSHGGIHGTGGAGGKNKMTGKVSISSVPGLDGGQYRKSHHHSNRLQEKGGCTESRKGVTTFPEPVFSFSELKKENFGEELRMVRVRSDDNLYRERKNILLPTHIAGGLVQAH